MLLEPAPEIGSEKKPVHVKFMLDEYELNWTRLLQEIATAIIPVAIVILLERPDVRQALKMRAAHIAKEVCYKQVDLWSDLALKSSTYYQKALL